MVIQTNLKCELQKAVRVQYLNGNLFSQDNQGNQINVEVFDGGSPTTLSGSVSANVIRADGGTVAVSSGTISGNVASVTLPSAAYAVPGVVSIIVKITSSGVITTLAAIVANVYQSSTDTAIDPGTLIPSIQTLISSIETAVASIPADYSSLWTSLAPAFDSSSNYTAGQFVTYDGDVYMFTKNHSGSWSASDAITVDIGNQVSVLKSNLERNLVRRDLVVSVLSATIADIGGTHTLYPNANGRVISFPVVSGKTYTVYKGYDMSGCRIAYSAVFPEMGGALTGYADFSSAYDYRTFTASTTGYACIRITYSNDVATAAAVLEKAVAYEGEYIEDVQQSTADLVNIKTFNGTQVSSLIERTDAIQFRNLICGYLYAQVANNTITESTNRTKLTVIFPVRSGAIYTVDKKVFTIHTRLGYTSTYPKLGDAIYNFEMPDSGGGCVHATFTAPQDGYCVLWVLDTVYNTTVTPAYIMANTIVYEGEFVSDYNQETLYLTDAVSNGNNIFYCGANRELSTLKAGIEKATKYMDSVLYVDSGTYDLVSEFGSAWFEALTSTDTMSGLVLKNRIHVVFSPNSQVVSNYTGNNEYAQKLYSPFNAGEYGFTLENLNLECSRCRYAIHDERNGGTENFKSHYINCHMVIDNSENDYWTNHHCIGGGLGTNAEVIFENCVFDCDVPDKRWGIYYHTSNSQNQNKRTKITIKDCYFVVGAISFEDAGANSNVGKSDYIVTNCSFKEKYEGTNAAGVFVANLSTNYANVYTWQNEFRT